MILLIPLAGGNEAFEERGHRYGKSLVELRGKPLIEHIWENLQPIAPEQVVFVIRKEDALRHHLHETLKLMAPNAVIIQAEGATGGSACTALLAIDHLVADDELVIANGDQLILADLSAALEDFRRRRLDAGTIVFDSIHPRWSFVRLDDNDLVVEASEKRPISRWATAGFYFYRRGGDFQSATMAMVRKDAQVGGQFYVCPTFNELILRQARIGVYRIGRPAYRSLATPQNVEEYEAYLSGRPKDRMYDA